MTYSLNLYTYIRWVLLVYQGEKVKRGEGGWAEWDWVVRDACYAVCLYDGDRSKCPLLLLIYKKCKLMKCVIHTKCKLMECLIHTNINKNATFHQYMDTLCIFFPFFSGTCVAKCMCDVTE